MLVGTTDVNSTELRKYVNFPEKLVTYTEELVPVWARHMTCLLENQRYYVAVLLRNMIQIPYKTRESCIEALLSNISISGVMGTFIPITDIIEFCDKEMLIKALSQDDSNG